MARFLASAAVLSFTLFPFYILSVVRGPLSPSSSFSISFSSSSSAGGSFLISLLFFYFSAGRYLIGFFLSSLRASPFFFAILFSLLRGPRASLSFPYFFSGLTDDRPFTSLTLTSRLFRSSLVRPRLSRSSLPSPLARSLQPFFSFVPLFSRSSLAHNRHSMKGWNLKKASLNEGGRRGAFARL